MSAIQYNIPLSFGATSIGKKGTPFSHFHTLEESQAIADLFTSRGGSAFVNCFHINADGTSQDYLAKTDLRGLPIDAKIVPSLPGANTPQALRKAVKDATSALAPHKIRIFFLLPDPTVPYEDTLREIDALYKEGYFQQFGLDNYYSWEVAEIYTICKLKGWVLPTAYEGRYNAMERNPEDELLPCLRRFGLTFHAFSPLAGGLLTGKWKKPADMDNKDLVTGTRFDVHSALTTPVHRQLYDTYKNAIPSFAALNEALEVAQIIPAEAALRWIQHHSALKPGDAVLIGASNIAQLEDNLKYSALGPLPEHIVELLDKASQSFKQYVTHYHAQY